MCVLWWRVFLGFPISGFVCWYGVLLVVWSFLASWFGGLPWHRVCGIWWFVGFSGLCWVDADAMPCIVFLGFVVCGRFWVWFCCGFWFCVGLV